MPKFRHTPMKTDMIRFVMATMDDSDNKRALLELVQYLSSILLCIHLSPLTPEIAARNCAQRILSRERHICAKTRNTLQILISSRKGALSVVNALVMAVNNIEIEYTHKVNGGLFCAA